MLIDDNTTGEHDETTIQPGEPVLQEELAPDVEAPAVHEETTPLADQNTVQLSQGSTLNFARNRATQGATQPNQQLGNSPSNVAFTVVPIHVITTEVVPAQPVFVIGPGMSQRGRILPRTQPQSFTGGFAQGFAAAVADERRKQRIQDMMADEAIGVDNVYEAYAPGDTALAGSAHEPRDIDEDSVAPVVSAKSADVRGNKHDGHDGHDEPAGAGFSVVNMIRNKLAARAKSDPYTPPVAKEPDVTHDVAAEYAEPEIEADTGMSL